MIKIGKFKMKHVKVVNMRMNGHMTKVWVPTRKLSYEEADRLAQEYIRKKKI